MSRYITDVELNKQLEALGLESSNREWVQDNIYKVGRLDIADLLEPENAKRLWKKSWLYVMKHLIKGYGVVTQREEALKNSKRLLEQYQNNPDKWQGWLVEQLGEGDK